MTGEADLLSSKFFWKNILFRTIQEKTYTFHTVIQGKAALFLKNSWKNTPKNVYEP